MHIIKKIIASIFSGISLIGSLLSIYSFFEEKSYNYIYCVTGIFLFIVFITISQIAKKNYDYTSLPVRVRLLPSLIDKIRIINGNNVYANIVSYSYKITSDNKLQTVVEIDGVTKYTGEYCIGILNSDDNANVELIIDKNILNPNKIECSDKYILYTFNLPCLLTNFTVKCIQDINHKKANLFFYPKNYVKKVKSIKINSNNKKLLCYKIGVFASKKPTDIVLKDGFAQLTSSKVNCVFSIEDYNS